MRKTNLVKAISKQTTETVLVEINVGLCKNDNISQALKHFCLRLEKFFIADSLEIFF